MAELSAAESIAEATIDSPCCAPEAQATCCQPGDKADCCGDGHGDGCGCESPAPSA